METLLKFAERIKDTQLKEKVVVILKDLKLSNKNFQKYKAERLDRAASVFSVGSSGLGPVERDVLNHTVALTEFCIEALKIFKEKYGLQLNEDYLIAGSLLHDLMKAFEFNRDEKGGLEPTGIMLDHTMLGVAELYLEDFQRRLFI